ncbi:MAG: hypothetical protein ACOC5I_03435 [Gemmatimonadota bacterium]
MLERVVRATLQERARAGRTALLLGGPMVTCSTRGGAPGIGPVSGEPWPRFDQDGSS